MKKTLFLALLLGCFCAANAQNISFIYNGTTYGEGDTIALAVEPNAHSFDGLYFKNNGSSAANDLNVVLSLVENDSLEVWGLCSGDACVLSLTSAPFDIAAGATYEEFSFDVRGTATVGNYAIYSITIGSTSAYLRFEVESTQGIREVRGAQAAPKARKIMYHNRIYIERDGRLYDLSGRLLSQHVTE